MNDKKYIVTLSDGTEIKNLRLNGNNFISTVEIKEQLFDKGLEEVTVTGPDGTQVWHNCKLIQVMIINSEWWFILAEKTQDEIEKERIEAENKKFSTQLQASIESNAMLEDCLAEMAEVVYA